MDKKTWLAVAGLALSMATNYVQHGSFVAKEEQVDATAHALSTIARAVERGELCRTD